MSCFTCRLAIIVIVAAALVMGGGALAAAGGAIATALGSLAMGATGAQFGLFLAGLIAGGAGAISAKICCFFGVRACCEG